MVNNGGPILYVDDEQGIETKALECRGWMVLSYKDAESAIKDINSGLKYHFAIIDRSLPDKSGEYVIATSKKVNPKVPVISLSGWKDKIPGADLNYKKPLSFRELGEKVIEPALENPEKFLEDLCLYTDIF